MLYELYSPNPFLPPTTKENRPLVQWKKSGPKCSKKDFHLND
jgi:hypothetical protein